MQEYELHDELRGRTMFYTKLPRWWKKLLRLGFPRSLWMSNSGYVKDTDIVSLHPYWLSLVDTRQLDSLGARYKVKVDILGKSDFGPGTIAITITPTQETYAILKLKPPANADCLTPEERRLCELREKILREQAFAKCNASVQ